MDISKIQSMVEDDGIVFISYGGFLTQSLISSMTEALEHEATLNGLGLGASNNIFTIFIELTQNMMNYSKSIKESCSDIVPGGLIVVSKSLDGNTYYVHSRNIISIEDKIKIEPKLQEIETLDGDQLKKRYRELRRSGANTHGKGGGIGFYEIAKKCNKIDYEFTKINESRYFFYLKTTINLNKKGE